MKIKIPFLLLVLILICACESPIHKPNIIFLLTDDQRWDALGAMGNDIIRTPNLDRLANEGILFTNAHVTTSICVVSRASILTGQYESRHGINRFQDTLHYDKLVNTYPLQLKSQAGYKIGFIGKYGIGLGHPSEHFDYWGCELMHQPNYENKDGSGKFIHYTDLVGSRIDEFLESYGKKGPFCLSVSFKAPHCQDGDPRQFIYHERYKDLYSDVDIELPETAGDVDYMRFPQDFRFPERGGDKRVNEARARWDIRFPDPETHKETVRSYYRLITGVDDCVGAMLEKLEALGIADNTIIVFTGDNGFFLGEHGMAGKWYAHQESLKVPLFVYDPGLEKAERGKRIDDLALNIDIAPTILSLAGLEVPAGMQGINLMDQEEVTRSSRKDFFYEHTIDIPTIPKSEALVGEHYKYIRYTELESGFEEFYDLEKDPFEKSNLIDNPDYTEEIEKAKARFGELKEKAR